MGGWVGSWPAAERSLAMFRVRMQAEENISAPEKTNFWGKDHSTAGLQLCKDSTASLHTNNNILFLVSSCLVKLESSRTVIFPPTVSVL